MPPLLHLAAAAVAAALAAAPAATVGAQATPAAPCPYDRCALSVEPRWDALALARGARGERVGQLGFFWPGDVRPLFAGSDSALHYARRAVATRRAAAALTDAGALLLALGIARAAHDGGLRGTGAGIAAGGAALFAVSVPLQFAADGRLARAVWWHNARFAR